MKGYWPFLTLSGWFLGLGLFQNMFHNLLIYTNNFCFGYIIIVYYSLFTNSTESRFSQWVKTYIIDIIKIFCHFLQLSIALGTRSSHEFPTAWSFLFRDEKPQIPILIWGPMASLFKISFSSVLLSSQQVSSFNFWSELNCSVKLG